MSLAIDVDVDFNGPQFAAYCAINPRSVVFAGFGRGVGKSYWIRACCYLLISQWEHRQRPNCPKVLRGIRILVLMPTLKQFKDVHWGDIETELGPGGDWEFLGAKLDRQSGQIKFPGGSWIKPFPASARNSKTARGMRADVLICDEVDDIESEVYNAVAIPWLSEPWSIGVQLLAGTPTRGHHGLWFRMLQNGRMGERIRSGAVSSASALSTEQARAIRAVLGGIPKHKWPKSLPEDRDQATLQILRSFHAFHATFEDAPETVDPVAVATARATMSEAAFKREWLADPDAGEGLVYPFDDQFHVREVPHGFEFNEYLVGVDHGFNPDPGVFLLAGVAGSGENAYVWILDEIYETERIGDWWVEQARTWSAATQPNSIWIRRALDRPASHLPFYCDPSGAERIAKLQQAGINALKANNSIEEGIDCVANLMAKRYSEDSSLPFARFYVRPNCVNTIRELSTYRRKPDPQIPGGYLPQPIDRNNHACDAGRYLCRARFGSGQGGRSERPR